MVRFSFTTCQIVRIRQIRMLINKKGTVEFTIYKQRTR